MEASTFPRIMSERQQLAALKAADDAEKAHTDSEAELPRPAKPVDRRPRAARATAVTVPKRSAPARRGGEKLADDSAEAVALAEEHPDWSEARRRVRSG